jgi:hypothetical protein
VATHVEDDARFAPLRCGILFFFFNNCSFNVIFI